MTQLAPSEFEWVDCEATGAQPLVESLTGQEFLDQYQTHDDSVTTVEPERNYPIRMPVRPLYSVCICTRNPRDRRPSAQLGDTQDLTLLHWDLPPFFFLVCARVRHSGQAPDRRALSCPNFCTAALHACCGHTARPCCHGRADARLPPVILTMWTGVEFHRPACQACARGGTRSERAILLSVRVPSPVVWFMGTIKTATQS
jgi:hypothetical protein